MANVMPTHQGFLSKKGDLHTGWKQRYFVKEGQDLYYYTSGTLKNCKGRIHLKGCIITDSKTRIENEFQIISQKGSHRIYYLRANNVSDKVHWMKILTEAAEGHINSGLVEHTDEKIQKIMDDLVSKRALDHRIRFGTLPLDDDGKVKRKQKDPVKMQMSSGRREEYYKGDHVEVLRNNGTWCNGKIQKVDHKKFLYIFRSAKSSATESAIEKEIHFDVAPEILRHRLGIGSVVEYSTPGGWQSGGVVLVVNEDGTYNLRQPDGSIMKAVSSFCVRALVPVCDQRVYQIIPHDPKYQLTKPGLDDWVYAEKAVKKGIRVFGQLFSGYNVEKIPGEVISIRSNEHYLIHFDEGHTRECPRDEIEFEKYPGQILEEDEEKFLVFFDDGTKEWVHEDRIEENRFRRGRIHSVQDASFVVQWDMGDKTLHRINDAMSGPFSWEMALVFDVGSTDIYIPCVTATILIKKAPTKKRIEEGRFMDLDEAIVVMSIKKFLFQFKSDISHYCRVQATREHIDKPESQMKQFNILITDITEEAQSTIVNAFQKMKNKDSHFIKSVKRMTATKISVNILSCEKSLQDQRHVFSNKIRNLLTRLHLQFVKTSLYKSDNEQLVYCLMGVTEERLKSEAVRIAYPLRLDPELSVQKAIEKGNMPLASLTADPKCTVIQKSDWKNTFVQFLRSSHEMPEREDIFAKYHRPYCGKRHGRTKSLFSSIDRIKLILSILELEKISVRQQMTDDMSPINDLYALHDMAILKSTQEQMTGLTALLTVDIDLIRAYFGEQIAFYFAFMQYYSRQLVIPGMLGIGTYTWQQVKGTIFTPLVPFFAVGVALWATGLMEFWKRQEARHRADWGMVEFELLEQVRPEYEGVLTFSPIDGREIKYFPIRTKFIRRGVSFLIIVVLLTLVCCTVQGLFLTRDYVIETGRLTHATAVYACSVLTMFQITVFNIAFSYVADWLNEYENHRTDTDFENSLIAKTFFFKFFNSYYSLFYIAFLQRYHVGCMHNTCLPALQMQLCGIFLSLIIFNNTLEIVMPLFASKMKVLQREDGPVKNREEREALIKKKEKIGAPIDRIKEAKREYLLEPYESTFDDFDEVVVQYGYVTLFVVAFPITPILAIISNMIEMVLDAYKITSSHRRPTPRGASNIGTWSSILNIMGYVAVITNTIILYLEMPGKPSILKVLMFLLMEHILFGIKFVIQGCVPDQPAQVTTRILRDKHIDKVLVQGQAHIIDFDGDTEDAHILAGGDETYDLDSIAFG